MAHATRLHACAVSVGGELMAVAETIPRRTSGIRAVLQQTPTNVWAIAGGALIGYVVMTVGGWPMRWLMFTLAGAIASVLIAAGHVRRQLMAYFVVALSLNVHYYITQPEEIMFLGMSGPRWISIPLILIPATGLAFFIIADAVYGRRRIDWGFSFSKAVLLLFLTAMVSTLASAQRRYGIYVLIEMMQFIFIYLVAMNLVADERDIQAIVRFLLLTFAIQCTIFIVQTASGAAFTLTGQVARATEGGLVRASGTVGTTPSGYAIFIEPFLFTLFALWRTPNPGLSRRWMGLWIAIGSATLVLTLNRTSWLTLFIGFGIVELLCRRRKIARPLSMQFLLSVIGVAILLTVVLIPLILPRLHADHSDDWTIRKNLMRIAINMIMRNPIIGVGPGAYVYHLRESAPGDVLGQWLWVVHNEFLLTWAERGTLGFLAWLLWLRAGLREAIRASTVPAVPFQCLGIGCVAALIGLLWEYSLNMWPGFSCYAVLWFLFGVLVAGNHLYERAAETDTKRFALSESAGA